MNANTRPLTLWNLTVCCAHKRIGLFEEKHKCSSYRAEKGYISTKYVRAGLKLQSININPDESAQYVSSIHQYTVYILILTITDYPFLQR